MTKTKRIKVQDTEISVFMDDTNDYICLTDMVKAKGEDTRAADIIKNWIRNRSTIEFLGTWETLYNPNFKVVEFDHFKKEAGLPTFTMSVGNWVEKTNAIGIISKSGRYGGTYAHKDIAFEFGSAISPMFKLYLIKEYQRLKEQENDPLLGKWNVHRILTKANYTLQTDALKSIMPRYNLTKYKEKIVYASEADMLNLIIFGCTAKDWEQMNPELAKKGYNLRDTTTINQLVVLSNIEARNSELLKQHGLKQKERMRVLHQIAKEQLAVLNTNNVEQKFRKLLGNVPKQLE